MATTQQRKALDVITKKVRKGQKVSISAVMREVGYSEETASIPGKLTNSKGFQELLNDAGLTDEFLNDALYSDIKTKKGNRKAELELAYKLRGRLKEAGAPPGNTFNVIVTDEQLSRIAGRLNGRGASDGGTPSESESGGLRDSDESEVRAQLAPREDSEGTGTY